MLINENVVDVDTKIDIKKKTAKRFVVVRGALSGVVRQLAQLAAANSSVITAAFRELPRVTGLRLAAGVAMAISPFGNWWGSGVVIEGLAGGVPLVSLWTGLVAMFASLLMLGILPIALAGLDKICENWIFRFVQSAIATKAVKLDQTSFTNPAFAAQFKQVKDRAVWRMMAMMRMQPLLLRSFGIITITIALLGSYNPALVLIVMLGFLPCVIIEARHARRQSKVDEELAPLWGRLWGDLWNLTTSVSIAMLQVFGASAWFAARYRDGLATAGDQENRLERSAVALRIAAAIVGCITLIGVSLTVMEQASSGELALGKMVFLLGAVSTLGLSLAEAATMFGQQSNQAYYVNALNNLLNTPALVSFPREGIPVDTRADHGIELVFDRVTFSYPGQGQSKPALEGVMLTVAAGSKVALVGPNGAGKSTAMALITRQIDPSAGTLRLDGIPLPILDEETLRGLIIQLPQSLRHYNLRLRDLLNLGRPGNPASDEEIRIATARTGADRFIVKWSAGLDTLLGNDQVNAVEPSGGQLQRLLLTAVLLASSRLIILDEPVSMVDPEAAKQFWDTVFKEMPHKTVIFSTHHLGAVRQADKILFIDDGRLVADGHHDELMESCPRYRNLFESQAGDYR